MSLVISTTQYLYIYYFVRCYENVITKFIVNNFWKKKINIEIEKKKTVLFDEMTYIELIIIFSYMQFNVIINFKQ